MSVSVATSKVIIEIGILTEQYTPSALDRPKTFDDSVASVLVVDQPGQISVGAVEYGSTTIATTRQQYYVSPPSFSQTDIEVIDNNLATQIPISAIFPASPTVTTQYPRRILSPYNVYWGEERAQGPQAQVFVTEEDIRSPVVGVSTQLNIGRDKLRSRFVNGAVEAGLSSSTSVYVAPILSGFNETIQLGQSPNIRMSYDYPWASGQNISELRPSGASGTTTTFESVEITSTISPFAVPFPTGIYSNQNGPVSAVYESVQVAAEPAHRPTSIAGGLEDISSPTGITATSRVATGTGFGILNPDAGVYARFINTKLNPQREGIAFKINGAAISRRYLRVTFDYYKSFNGTAYEGAYPHIFDAVIGISSAYNGIPFNALGQTAQSFPTLNHDARAQLRRRFYDSITDSEEYSAILLSNGAQTADVRSREDSTNNTYTNMTIFDYQNTASLTDFFPAPNETTTDKTTARIVYLIDFQTGDHYFYCRNKYLKTTLELICTENTGLTSYDQNKDTYLLWGLSPFAYDTDCFVSNAYINQIHITMADTWDTVDILTDPMAEPTGSYSNVLRSWEETEDSPNDLLSADQQAGVETTEPTPISPRIDFDLSKVPAFSPGTVYMYPQVKIAIDQPWPGDAFSGNKWSLKERPIRVSIGTAYFTYPSFVSSNTTGKAEVYVDLPVEKPDIEAIYLYKQKVSITNNKRQNLPNVAHNSAEAEVYVESPLVVSTIEDNAVFVDRQSLPIITGLDRYFNPVNNFNSIDIIIPIDNIDFNAVEIAPLNFGYVTLTASYDRYGYYFIATQPRVANATVFTYAPGEELVFFEDQYGVTKFGLATDFFELPAGAGGFSSFELLISE